MGMGWSDAGPSSVSIATLTTDLERLLDRAAIRPPYLLMPSSMGGLVAELYVRRHPDRIAGLVFVDAGHSAVLDLVASRVTWRIAAESCLPRLLAPFGLLRLLDPLGLRRDPAYADENVWRIYRTEPMTTLCGVAGGIQESVNQFRAAPPLAPDVPLTVLTAESTDGLLPPGYGSEAEALAREWRRLQQALSQRSSRGTWRIVPRSDHLIANSQPHEVAAAVLDMLERIRGK
jgi:pimeloyl-ACP methyl ester carboxylesterase